jgi:hypothetical protein
MSVPRFRVWYGKNPASLDDLARIEDIEITQEMDRFWEARLRTAMRLDDQGAWQNRADSVASPFSRIRVELDPGDGNFVPLIDGPVSGYETQLSSQPGRSTATFAIRDDSVFLNRDEETEVFQDRRDSEIAEEVLLGIDQIVSTRVDPPTSGTSPITTRRGTRLLFLSELARVNERRVYVLPGESAGNSIGCFLPDPEKAGNLPALRLIGDERNLADATIEENSESPSRTRGTTLRISDGSIASSTASASDIGLGGDRPAVPDDLAPLRMLPPHDSLREDPEQAVKGRAREDSYAFKMTSNVVPGGYGGVLTPYIKVRVECGKTPYSGDWLITKVVHHITPSLYSQRFEAKSNGSTDVEGGGGLSSALAGVF